MPSPSSSLATLRPDLGSLMEFDLDRQFQGFIAYQVLPILQVALSASTFGRIKTEHLGKLSDVTRGPKGDYNRIDWAFGEDSYATREYGLEGVVSDRNAKLYANYFDAEMVTAKKVLFNILAKAEQRVAAAVFNATTFTGSALTTAVTNEWDDTVNATPITDVLAGSQKVRDNCGRYPNAAVMNRKVFRNLRECEQIIERIKASGAGDKVKPSDINAQMIAACFDLERVIVADSSYDATNEGQATSFSSIWSDEYCMLCVINDSPDVETPCLGRTFHWGEDGSEPGGLVEGYGEDAVRAQVIRVRHDVQEKIIYPECGHLLSNITT